MIRNLCAGMVVIFLAACVLSAGLICAVPFKSQILNISQKAKTIREGTYTGHLTEDHWYDSYCVEIPAGKSLILGLQGWGANGTAVYVVHSVTNTVWITSKYGELHQYFYDPESSSTEYVYIDVCTSFHEADYKLYVVYGHTQKKSYAKKYDIHITHLPEFGEGPLLTIEDELKDKWERAVYQIDIYTDSSVFGNPLIKTSLYLTISVLPGSFWVDSGEYGFFSSEEDGTPLNIPITKSYQSLYITVYSNNTYITINAPLKYEIEISLSYSIDFTGIVLVSIGIALFFIIISIVFSYKRKHKNAYKYR